MAFRTLLPLFDQLEGERVLIRPYRLDDADALYEAIAESRDHLRPWLPFADETEDEARDYLVRAEARWLLREGFDTGIWSRETGRFLGSIGAHPRDWDVPSFEIGYWLRASAEGQGYLTEAGRMLTAYLFTHLGANRLEIRCDARNIRSANAARRLGFVQEAHMRNQRISHEGKLRDTLVFSMIPADRQ
ncbi:MAG TPA: GNAT family N-acetyltransferase [Ktedonobacterales bacterium]|jgi:RimJ/RimL family protein N-acetyltransferase